MLNLNDFCTSSSSAFFQIAMHNYDRSKYAQILRDHPTGTTYPRSPNICVQYGFNPSAQVLPSTASPTLRTIETKTHTSQHPRHIQNPIPHQRQFPIFLLRNVSHAPPLQAIARQATADRSSRWAWNSSRKSSSQTSGTHWQGHLGSYIVVVNCECCMVFGWVR